MKQTAAFVMFLVLICIGYMPPEPMRSPLALPMSGIAGISDCEQLTEMRANAWYTWATETGRECDDSFIPMIRDSDDWWKLYNGETVITPTLLLGFNEPDLLPPPGSDLTPEEALPMERWRLTHYTNTLHISPAPSQNDTYWLYRLRNLYIDEYGEPPAWDYLACHCYFYDTATMRYCKQIVNRYIWWSQLWGAEGVLVTEFAAGAVRHSPYDEFDYDTAVEYGEQFINWLDEQPKIKGRFWYSVNDWGVWGWNVTTALYDGNGELTPLGEMYRDSNYDYISSN